MVNDFVDPAVCRRFLNSLLLRLNSSLAWCHRAFRRSRKLLGSAHVVPRLHGQAGISTGYFFGGSVGLSAGLGLTEANVLFNPAPPLNQIMTQLVSGWQFGILIAVLCFALIMSMRYWQIKRENKALQARLAAELQQNEHNERRLQRIRRDIARDLHDDLGPDLSGLTMLSQVVATQLVGQPHEARATLTRLSETARQLVSNMREIIWSLNATNLSVESTLFRLQETAHTIFAHQPAELYLMLPDTLCENDIPPESRRELFLMFKEMLHNAVRHAFAQHVCVEMVVRDQMLCLTVSDDGVGFDVAAKKQAGTGLTSLYERANALGGQLNIDSEPGQGTTVYFCGPVLVGASPVSLPALATASGRV